MKKATLQTDGTWKIEEFTAEEEADYNETVASGKALQDASKAAAAKKATDKASAKIKLKALGLTDDEITAFIGS